MGLKTEKPDKILELFYEYPRESFTVRKIAKKTKIPKSTVQKYLLALKKKNLVTKDNQASTSLLFKTKKVNYFIEKIVESGVIEFLDEQLKTDCIILFGSFRKGESEEESDLDIYVETHHEKELKLDNYEKKIKHKIDLHIHKSINDLPDELRQNVINGIKLSGYLRLI
ncbi:MAG: nucleotidyltransferase domain-containing protein [Nanoarchaeota archaeon]|nr:nucleotidyltransferase domain-containing protein [Nanoarchaeota archaeon]MBU1974373.1 nucleotidyltransferase domain-containing protein [Nanoarchaeota archaeon]